MALWPEYGEVIGGRFFYEPAECRGQQVLDSGYRHDVPHGASVLDSSHPITKGLDDAFPLTDELYLYEVFEGDVQPLLSSDYSFDREHFYSAHHAVTGNMFCNDDWPHPEGSSLIGWQATRQQPYLLPQPGDGGDHASPHYRSWWRTPFGGPLPNSQNFAVSPGAKQGGVRHPDDTEVTIGRRGRNRHS